MRRIAVLSALLALACTDPASITEPEAATHIALQTTYNDTTLQLYLNPDQSLQPGTSSTFVHLRVLVRGTALPASQLFATFKSSNSQIISLPHGGGADDDRTRIYAMSNGTARITADWRANGKTYRTSRDFTVGSATSTSVDTTIHLYLNPEEALTVGDNSVFLHARVLVGGKALPASQVYTTFTTSNAEILGVPNGSVADDDRTRLFPKANGTARISTEWRANGKLYRGSRDFTVGGSAQSPSAPPAGTSLANECWNSRPEWIWCDDFDADRLAKYFEYSSASGRFVRAGGTGIGGSSAMRVRFAAGTVGAGSLKIAFGKTPGGYIRAVDAGTSKFRDIYWRVFVYYPAGWEGGVGHKVSRATSLVNSNWAQSMIAHVWSGNPYLYIDPASGTDASGNLRTTKYNDFDNLRWLGARKGVSSVSTRTGVWHCIETRARLNDAGQSNGAQQLWVNGVLEAERTGLNFVGSYSDYGINAVFLENYWNGGAPKTQDRFFDNFVVSTKRIGCGG